MPPGPAVPRSPRPPLGAKPWDVRTDPACDGDASKRRERGSDLSDDVRQQRERADEVRPNVRRVSCGRKRSDHHAAPLPPDYSRSTTKASSAGSGTGAPLTATTSRSQPSAGRAGSGDHDRERDSLPLVRSKMPPDAASNEGGASFATRKVKGGMMRRFRDRAHRAATASGDPWKAIRPFAHAARSCRAERCASAPQGRPMGRQYRPCLRRRRVEGVRSSFGIYLMERNNSGNVPTRFARTVCG